MNHRKIAVVSIAVLLSAVTFVALSMALVTEGVDSFYVPNLVEANYGLKYISVFALILFVNWLFAIYSAVWDKTDRRLTKLCVTIAIFIITVSAFFFLTAIPRNYNAEYYLGQEKYSVPWQYNPINGSRQPGGTYFVIHVSYPDLKGQYDNPNYRQHELILSKDVFDEKEKIGETVDDVCSEESECSGLSSAGAYFLDDGFIYHVSYQGEPMTFKDKDELQRFKASIINLFDSFKA